MNPLSRLLAIVSAIAGAATLSACAASDPADGSMASTEVDDVIVGDIISVTQWQEDLRGWQIHFETCRPSVTVDGIFGPMTDTATRCFQRVKGITADGLVGLQTLSVMCHDLIKFSNELWGDSDCLGR